MMSIAELPPGGMILKYKSVFLLEREADDIRSWFDREWKELDRLDHVSKAVLDDDRDTLAKAADAELQKVREHIAGLRKQHTAFPICALHFIAFRTERLLGNADFAAYGRPT
jgi:hypothetical protein